MFLLVVFSIKTMAAQENDQELSDNSASVISGSSYSDYEEPWLEHIKSDGSLFFLLYDDIDLNYLSEQLSEQHMEHAEESSEKRKSSSAEKIKKWMLNRGKRVKKFIPTFKKNSRNVNPGSLNNMPLQSQSEKSQFVMHRHDDLILELDGDPTMLENARSQFQHVPHGLFFLSIGNNGNDAVENDVLYRYPDENTPLFKLKGMLLTLGLMIDDVATPPLLSCSIMIEDEIVHVGYVKEGDSVMVLAIPASVASVAEVQHFTSILSKWFKFQFCTLTKTFLTGNEDNYLDNFLTLFFKHHLSCLQWDYTTFPETHLLDLLPSAHWLPLSSDIKTDIDNILTEFESADFGNDSAGYENFTRIFNICGSCFFHKGYLISRTLQKDDFLDIYVFLKHAHILELTEIQPIQKIVIWREVFPSRQQDESTNDPEYEEAQGRWFLAVVVMGQSILAALLVDSGCALKADQDCPPEPFYIQEVTNTLLVFEAGELLSILDEKIKLESGMISSEMFKDNSSRNSLSSAFPSNVSINSSGSYLSASHSSLGAIKEGSSDKTEEAKRQQLLSSIGPADGESSCNEFDLSSAMKITPIDFSSDSEFTESTSEITKDIKDQVSRNFSSLPNLNVPSCASDGTYFQNSLKMLSGFGNNLFYYLHMDPVEGIYIAPLTTETTVPDTIDDRILKNFHITCMSMRKIFERSLRNTQITEANIQTKYKVNSFPQHAYEQGLSFTYNKPESAKEKRSHQDPDYWVIGRLFFAPEPREVYVCYCGIIPQDVVELSFRLGFGLSF